jgi:hypothetical protein
MIAEEKTTPVEAQSSLVQFLAMDHLVVLIVGRWARVQLTAQVLSLSCATFSFRDGLEPLIVLR